MLSDFRYFIPTPQSAGETLEAQQVSYEFYREVAYREELADYCQWYELTAQQHRQELQKMRGDFNLFGWFCRGRRS